MSDNKKPTILITNDDGIYAKGIRSLIKFLKPLGDIFVVAPDGPRSAQSSALTVSTPIRVKKVHQEEGLTEYICNGTPADCVKIAIKELSDKKFDLVVSGINHGMNTSISIIYSGTMGAAIEGSLNEIPSIGFSLNTFDPGANFEPAEEYVYTISKNTLEKGLPINTCLNVNIPAEDNIKGIKICRQSNGHWNEEFIKRKDPLGKNYYWLSGEFHNAESHIEDTDDWALKNKYISIVPTKVDMTAYEYMNELKNFYR